jgi:hypothetical protein
VSAPSVFQQHSMNKRRNNEGGKPVVRIGKILVPSENLINTETNDRTYLNELSFHVIREMINYKTKYQLWYHILQFDPDRAVIRLEKIRCKINHINVD